MLCPQLFFWRGWKKKVHNTNGKLMLCAFFIVSCHSNFDSFMVCSWLFLFPLKMPWKSRFVWNVVPSIHGDAFFVFKSGLIYLCGPSQKERYNSHINAFSIDLIQCCLLISNIAHLWTDHSKDFKVDNMLEKVQDESSRLNSRDPL